jgi:hypothetical protein
MIKFISDLLNPIQIIQSFLLLNIQFHYAQSDNSDDLQLLNIQF